MKGADGFRRVRRADRHAARQARFAWFAIMPVASATALLLAVPTIGALLLSLTDFDIYALASLGNLRFVGLANYAALFADPSFWRAALNTGLFALFGVPAALGASLAAALLVSAATVGWKPLWRLLLFAPFVTTLVASAVVWRYVLDTRAGLLNRGLAVVGMAPVDWLGNPRTSIPAVLLFIVWKVFGYNMLVFTAALATVPAELHDAARIDGAGAWSRFCHVTLPAIGPAVLLAALLSVTNFLQIFTEPYVMTHGGPAQRTVTLLYFMFEQGFEWWNLGIASTVAMIVFLVILAVTVVQARIGAGRGWL